MDESPSNRLLTDKVLEHSGVVANCRMNRERVLTGSNGYSTDLLSKMDHRTSFNSTVRMYQIRVRLPPQRVRRIPSSTHRR